MSQPSPNPESAPVAPAFEPPPWAKEFLEQHRSNTARLFVLHGNVHDLFDQGDGREFGSLSRFLATWMFAKYDVVLRYDLSHGLDVYTGSDGERRRKMLQRLEPIWGEFRTWPRDPENVLKFIDALVTRIMLDEGSAKDMSLGVIFEYAQYLAPSSDLIRGGGPQAANLVQYLSWASNPYLKQEKVAFCLLADPVTELNERLVGSPHVSSLAIPLPEKPDRARFIQAHDARDGQIGNVSDFDAERLAELTSGLNLVSIDRLLSLAEQSGKKLDAAGLKTLKKNLIERQLRGLIEFVEPPLTMANFVGNEAVRQRLEDDVKILTGGHLSAAPMGYLICGPVGTGKTFLAECFAGSVGIPCVKLRNFRSKYVGETEANLERILTVLRVMGPVVVVIDEADAALGNRQADGDSGTSQRVFSQLASQMGDTKYRGKLVWMLMTSRPDLLPIDLKRQGRAEVHLPLFAPRTEDEVKAMFMSMAKKNKLKITAGDLPEKLVDRGLSGADIESIVLASRRLAIVADRPEPTKDDLSKALADFIPSAEGLQKEKQEIAAVLESTSLQFLPERWRQIVAEPEGRAKLQRRMAEIDLLVRV
ncbi:AAA family ATPase [bacterium]|nr:AAA family ATPase [bacterium]